MALHLFLINNNFCKGEITMTTQCVSKPKQTCQVKGCNRECHAKEYCKKHYCQMHRHGKILPRTIRTPNEFVFKGNICKIKLYNRKHEEIAEAIIDKKDFILIKDKKWHLLSKGYVATGAGRKQQLLHWMIIGKPFYPYETDHKDQDKLNNRKDNLRHCTSSQNEINKKLRKNNTSGYTGVLWRKDTQKWSVSLGYQGKQIRLGCYQTKEKAAKVYNKAVVRLFGEYAVLNNI